MHKGVAKIMLKNGAIAWALGSDQIGGHIDGIEPLYPTTFLKKHPPGPKLKK